jgi:hypothetical protein
MEDNKPVAKNDPLDQYFARKSASECAHVLLNKGRTFFNILEGNSYIYKIQNMWRAYSGSYSTEQGEGHQISFTGEQGELVRLPVNHFSNLARHTYNMVTANRPTMEARAVNTDYKSLSQTYLANGILDYYMREKGLEEVLNKAVEFAIVLGSGYLKLEWNATSGDAVDVDPETGELHYTGEIEFKPIDPLNVIFDGTKETWDHEWIVVRSFKNKYNLMAKFPELASKIEQLDTKTANSLYRLSLWSNDDTVDIPVFEFFHKKTEAMPEGRYMLFCSDDIVLLDTPMPYNQIPVHRIVPREILGTCYGYSDMFDVFPIQEMINATYSAIATNQNAFAVQNVYIPREADINITSIAGGMQVFEGNAKPEALNLTQTPAEVYKFLEVLIQAAETMSGINSVTRGSPGASLESGAALALVQSMSLQFINGLQQSYVKMVESVGTGLIQILQDYAHTPKLVAIVGRNNRSLLKTFTGSDIANIKRVVVDIGNPLSRTTAGRVQMADQLAQMKLLKNPQQYFQVLNTGRLDVLFEGEMSELLLIKSENESLLSGEKVNASILDQHRSHILEHKSVMADPDLRKDPNLIRNVQDHILEHINLLRNGDPDLLQLIGEQPLNPPQAAGNPEMPPGPMNNQEVIEGSPIPDVQQSQTLVNQADNIQQANVPGVDPSLLPNAAIQEQAPGGVKK